MNTILKYLLIFSIAFTACIALSHCEKTDTGAKTVIKEGTIRDLSGVDGCNYVIELDNGDILVPVNLDSFPQLVDDNQSVEFTYEDSPESVSTCSVGETVIITWMDERGCGSILTLDSSANADYPLNHTHDPFELDTAYIVNDCIHFVVRYSGGCEHHEFTFGLMSLSSLANNYILTHNANGDVCEAYITDTISFDLTPLRQPNYSEITFNVGIYTTQIIHYYTITYTY